MQIPDFTQLRPEIDSKLNDILHKTFQRNRDDRYQGAAELLTALEVYLYSDGYGPTNEKLADYVQDIFDKKNPESLAHQSTSQSSS
jgi:serine/threonine-protein kinase